MRLRLTPPPSPPPADPAHTPLGALAATTQQLEELEKEPAGPNQWDAAAHNEISEEGHHEYWMRRQANGGQGDAVVKGLAYKPVSKMMPVPEKDDNPYWGWFKKT